MALFGNKGNQYIELPKDNDNSKLFYKVELTDAFKKDAKITVPPTHTVLFIKDGKIHSILEEGIHDLYEKTGGFWIFKHNVKDFHTAYALYVSKTAKIPVYWGTNENQKINYVDPKLGYPIALRAFGSLEVKVNDAKKFYLEVVASSGNDTYNDGDALVELKEEVEKLQKRKTLKQSFTKEDEYDLNKKLEQLKELEHNSNDVYSKEKLQNRFRPKAVSIISEKIKAKIIETNVSYFDLDAYKSEIQQNVFTVLKTTFLEDYGLELRDFLIESLNIGEDEEEQIKQVYKEKQRRLNHDEDRAYEQKLLSEEEEDLRRKLAFKKSLLEDEDAILDNQKRREREEIDYQLKIKREEEDRAWRREREEMEIAKEIELNKIYHDSVKVMGWEHSPVNKRPEQTMAFCTKCGAEVGKDDLFCGSCGAPTKPESIKDVCPKCGREINMKVLFCPGCGQKIKQDGKVTTVTVVEEKTKGTKK